MRIEHTQLELVDQQAENYFYQVLVRNMWHLQLFNRL